MMPNFSTPAGPDCQDVCPAEISDHCQQGRCCPHNAERAAARVAALPRWARRVIRVLTLDATGKTGR